MTEIRRIDAGLLVIQICSRGSKVFQRSIPSKNVVPDCHAAFADSCWKRTQPSSSIPWNIQTKKFSQNVDMDAMPVCVGDSKYCKL